MINENIIKFRKKIGISQRELGRRSGISGQMVSKIENDITKPSIDTLKKIAESLEVSLSEIIGDDIQTYKIDASGNLIETNDIEAKKNASVFKYNQEHGEKLELPYTKENYLNDKTRYFVDSFSTYLKIDPTSINTVLNDLETEHLKEISEFLTELINLREGDIEWE